VKHVRVRRSAWALSCLQPQLLSLYCTVLYSMMARRSKLTGEINVCVVGGLTGDLASTSSSY
jgi:hypothetical protein